MSIVGRGVILEVSDFKTMRPTHYDEADVYICESVYDESRRQIGPLPPTGLKTYEHISLDVLADEVYYFKSPITVRKVSSKPLMPFRFCINMNLYNASFTYC